MAGSKSYRFIFTALMVALPAMAAAQSSTFVVPFERVGTPTTVIELQPDPLNPGGALIPVPVDKGAFVNPCTTENVDVIGSSAISTLTTVDKFGNRKVSVSTVTKGTGAGWVPDLNGNPIFTTSTYSFNENQSFKFELPPATTSPEFTSTFSDKLSMRGAKSIDNWTIRATFRIRVDAAGTVKVTMEKLSGDICKG